MKSRMDRYKSEHNIPSRTAKNDSLYDDIYSQKREPASNITVLDNINEIDINKIKSMISNREDYKKIKGYKELLDHKTQDYTREMRFNFDDYEEKNYDINEILERKRSNRETDYERDKIRKISNTQYDILRGLNINDNPEHNSDTEEMDMDFFTQEKQLKTLIQNITKDNESDEIKHSSIDLFENLKGDKHTAVTPPITKDDNIDISSIENTFYTSGMTFDKEDFEDFEKLQTNVKKSGKLMKILIIVFILLLLCIGVIVISNYVDFKALLN